MAANAPTSSTDRLFGQLKAPGVFLALVALAVAAIAIERLWLAAVRPLWFDEAWSAMMAFEPDWRTLEADAWSDVNAPAYPVLMRLWAAVAGHSNLALRLPAIVAVALAGLAPLAFRPRGLSREAAVTWGALIFGWWGVGIFLDGRGYGLLMALSTAQAIVFARLLSVPTRGRAALWCGLAASAILVQYYALIPAAVQGLAYLAIRREAAVRTWPAALLFAPTFGWIAFHSPTLRAYMASGVAWHPRIGFADAVSLAGFAINPTSLVILPTTGLIILGAWLTLKRRPPDAAEAEPVPELGWVAAAALAALAIALIAGALRPTLTGRYLIPMVPGLLLGVVLAARRSAWTHLAYAALITLFLGVAAWPGAFVEALGSRSPYGYEDASRTLMRHGVRHVVFIWDHEVSTLESPGALARAGEVFFRRAGYPVTVSVVTTRPTQDTTPIALAKAGEPDAGIIWIYNRGGETSARYFPPRIRTLDPRWRCERTGDADLGSLACWRGP